MVELASLNRVVKNPGFLKKTQPTRVFLGILKFNLVDRTGVFFTVLSVIML